MYVWRRMEWLCKQCRSKISNNVVELLCLHFWVLPALFLEPRTYTFLLSNHTWKTFSFLMSTCQFWVDANIYYMVPITGTWEMKYSKEAPMALGWLSWGTHRKPWLTVPWRTQVEGVVVKEEGSMVNITI